MEKKQTAVKQKNTLKKGQQVFFTNDSLPYNVMAVSSRYAVVSRKLNKKEDDDLLSFEVERDAFHSKKEAYNACKNSPVYSIIDFKENIRATDNLIFGIYDYFSEDECENCISDLNAGKIELSHRTRIELNID